MVEYKNLTIEEVIRRRVVHLSTLAWHKWTLYDAKFAHNYILLYGDWSESKASSKRHLDSMSSHSRVKTFENRFRSYKRSGGGSSYVAAGALRYIIKHNK